MTDGYDFIIDPQVPVRRGRLTRRLRRRLRIQWSRPAHLSNPISQALTTAQVWLQGTPQVPELFPQLQAPVESGVCTRTDSRQQKHCQQQRHEGPPAALDPHQDRHHCCPCGAEVRGRRTTANSRYCFVSTVRSTQTDIIMPPTQPATAPPTMPSSEPPIRRSGVPMITLDPVTATVPQTIPRQHQLHQIVRVRCQVTSRPGLFAGGGCVSTSGTSQTEHNV